MLSEQELREVKELEKSGANVVISNGGKLEYSTLKVEDSEYCINCSSFLLAPDPDPYDWFRDEDMKAICSEVNGVIEGGLERPSEWSTVHKPLYCPKLGRELTEEEKEKAAKDLEEAKKRMEKG